MDNLEYESIIQWCCRQCYYNEMLSYAKQAIDDDPANDRFGVYLALAQAFTNQTKESLKQVSVLVRAPETALAALLIQSFVQNTLGCLDPKVLAQSEMKIREESKKASPYALAVAAMVMVLLHKFDLSKEYSNRAAKLKPGDQFVLLSRGWSHLLPDLRESTEKSPSYFEMVVNENGKNFNALLGLAKFKELRGDHSEAISILNSLIVRFPKMSLPLVEKINNLLALKDWDQVLETANRILTLENSNLDAIKVKAFVAICNDGNHTEGAKFVQAFFRNLLVAEGKNVELFVENVKVFRRIACREQAVLVELFKVSDKMSQMNPGNSAVMVEMGNLCLRMEKFKDAEHWFKSALKIEDSSFAALMGQCQCHMMDSSLSKDGIKQQLNYLYQLNEDSIRADLLFMSTKLLENEPNKVIEYLENSAEVLINSSDGMFYGYEYLKALNPDLSLDIVNEYLRYSSSTCAKASDVFLNVGKSPCLCILERVIEACPGLSNASLLLGKLKMQSGDFEGAISALKVLLDTIDQANVSGYLLMAQILVLQGDYLQASQTLELGLSYNFRVRDNPMYHMILGIINKESGNYDGAIVNFQTAMSYAGFASNEKSTISNAMSLSDKTTLYLQFISVYCKLQKFDEAMRLMDDIKSQLKNTPEEGQAIIGNADLCLEMDDIDKAIENLSSILPGQPFYLQAHTKLAEIYLYRQKDRYSFARCFRDLVEHCPGPKTYSMLGDAYLAIQEPEKAIEAYELSLKNSTGDKSLARKMGVALVKTHQYTKAINYYKSAIKREGFKDLKLDMSELFMKLKQFDKAEELLLEELKDTRSENDLQTLELRGRQLRLLAKVREKAGKIEESISTLNEAKENQLRYAQRTTMMSNSEDPTSLSADTCFEIAEHAMAIRDFKLALANYKEVLKYQPEDVKALLSLSKLYMQMNDLEKCTLYCTSLLTAEPNNKAALVMMADLAFRKVDFETAAFHFRQLLLQKPTYWTALARLIEVSRRTGNLDDLEEWISKSEAAMNPAKPEAGFYYCLGLWQWRTGKMNAAFRNFKAARRDPEWGQQAIYNMIELCLGPEESALSAEIFSDDNFEYEDSRQNSLKTAKSLLQELDPKGNLQEMITHRLLTNFYLLATRTKTNIEKALQDCTAILSLESFRDHVGPALGLATAHVLLKQVPRARNHLKRVSKNIWTFEDAEYLERCWLLLSDIHTQNGKFDAATELLKKVLQHNATCVRAHEVFAYIAEKEQNYKEAATRYAQAWKYGGKSKFAVGYKLAYCCLKSKAYADAIEACNQVIKLNPDFPRLKKDILEKAIANLRT